MDINDIFTKVGVILALILSIFNIYTNLEPETPNLSIQSFPERLQGDMNEDLEAAFFLYNEGTKPAFIDYIYFENINAEMNPKKDFVINPGESYEVNLIAHAPGEAFNGKGQVHVYYGPDNKKVSSDIIEVRWD